MSELEFDGSVHVGDVHIQDAYNVNEINITDNHSTNVMSLVANIAEVKMQDRGDEKGSSVKINISTTQPQQMTCDEADNFVVAHIGGLRRTLDDPENPEALYPLSEDSVLSQSIEMTDGIYIDTEEKLEENGINITNVMNLKYYRMTIEEEAVQNAFSNVPKDEKGRINLTALSQITTLNRIDDNRKFTDLSILYYCPNITSMTYSCTDGTWVWGKSDYKNLSIMCGKWIKTFPDRYKGFQSLKRLVMPSFVGGKDGGNFEHASYFNSCELIDFGINTRALYGSKDFNAPGCIVIRNSTTISTKEATPAAISKYIFVPHNMLESYKTSTIWSKYAEANKIKAIGGPTWVSEFGSSDPYADLTDEERSWYEDLFPDLYKDWEAPTTD